MKDAYICKHSYLPMAVIDIYSYLQIAMQICTDPCKFGNQGPTSSLWASVPQLNGFVKLLFSNTPGALGYKFRLTSQSQSFSAPYISVCVCGVFWCPHIYMYLMCVCPCFLNVLFRQKRYEDNIWLGQGMLRMAKRRILFYSWEVFFRPKIGFKVSISFGCEKQLKMSNKEKESPLIYVTLKQFSCI